MNNNKKVDKRRRGNRRQFDKDQERDSRVEKKDFTSKGCNDISWYAQDATLLRNVANFPWSTQAGLSYDDLHTLVFGTTPTPYNTTFTTPGICALHILPGLGNTKYQLDAVNVAANAMYVFIRHMNSGAKNYDAPDLMNYILAMDEVFSMINFCQRLYGTLGMYSVYNRYTPDMLIKMQGIDPDDLRENMVQFRYRLNTIIKQAATLVVPATFPVFQRHAFLFQDYYIEGNDMKDQIYLYTPINFRKFNIPSGGGPGELIYSEWEQVGTTYYYRLDPARLLTADKLLDKLQDMVSRIYLDEDFGTMAGDILKAYGESKVVRLSELPDAYVCTLKQNNEVLLQFKNCNMNYAVWDAFSTGRASSSDPYVPTFGEIHQNVNTNRIYENLTLLQPTIGVYGAVSHDSHMLTLEGEPSPEMNMIMSRLIHDYYFNTASGTVDFICGTEIVGAMTVNWDCDPFSFFTTGGVIPYVDGVAGTISNGNLIESMLSVFKYHPCVYIIHATTASPSAVADVYSILRIYQVDNFTIISGDVLDRLHQVAIMSEFNVPHMALIG